MKPWTPEVTVDAALAARLLAAQFPPLAGAHVEPFGQGWDNTGFLVDGRWVFRFPRRAVAVPLLQAEGRLLPWLAPQLPLPIPRPQWLGRPDADFPWPFAGYPLLPGTTACRLDLEDAQRSALARPLGSFLRALHDVDPAAAQAQGAQPDPIGRFDLPRRVQVARPYLDRLRDVLPEAPAVLAELEASVDLPVPPGPLRVVHGDLYARHLLLRDGELAGVIDWGDVHLGLAAADLAVVHSFLPRAAHVAFLDVYGPVDPATWRLARFRALAHGAGVACSGVDLGDVDLAREGLGALRRLVAA